jgi:hypothetical protein
VKFPKGVSLCWIALAFFHSLVGVFVWSYRALFGWIPSLGIVWIYEKLFPMAFRGEIGWLEYSVVVDRVSIGIVLLESMLLIFFGLHKKNEECHKNVPDVR